MKHLARVGLFILFLSLPCAAVYAETVVMTTTTTTQSSCHAKPYAYKNQHRYGHSSYYYENCYNDPITYQPEYADHKHDYDCLENVDPASCTYLYYPYN